MLLALVALNLTMGFLAYRYMGKVDANYSEAMDKAIKSQEMLRKVSTQAARTLANTVLFLNKKTRSEDVRKEIRDSGEVSDAIYEVMAKGPFLSPKMKEDFDKLRQKRAMWRGALVEELEILKTGNDERAAIEIKNRVDPLLYDYLDSLDRYCAANQSLYSTLNNTLTQQTNNKQQLMFGLSLLPIALYAMWILLLVLVILLSWLVLKIEDHTKELRRG